MMLTESQALTLMSTLATHSVEHIQHFADKTAGDLMGTLMSIATAPQADLLGIFGAPIQAHVVEHLQRATVEALQHQTECDGCK